MIRCVGRAWSPFAFVAFAVVAAAALAPEARAQAGIEASRLTQQSTENAPPQDEGPDWTRSATPRPASRFRTTANIPPEAHGIMRSIESGTYYGYPSSPGLGGPGNRTIGRGIGRGGRQVVEVEPVRKPRKKSGMPGTVAGLVYERADKRPVAGALLQLISTEPDLEIVRLAARTDSAGYYEFADVEPGRWALAVVADRLDPKYAPLRAGTILIVAKRERVAAPPFALSPTSCALGHAVWSDGYVLYDAPVTVAPYDTTLLTVGGLANGIGDFRVCGAATDSVMVWMHLRDGRSLGRTTRLSPGAPMHVDFTPDPLERMEGTILRVLPVTNDGRPIPKARITIVGRRFEQGARPALVFVREESADRDGAVEVRVPWGVYEVLAVNARDGQSALVEHMVVDSNPDGVQPLRLELRGPSTPAELVAMREKLLDRAETMLYVWTQ